jgi:hypothetical protein
MTAVTTAGDVVVRNERRNLVRHLFEMVAAMLVGMAALGVGVRVACAALRYSDFLVEDVRLARR